jgi:hypothetical protein
MFPTLSETQQKKVVDVVVQSVMRMPMKRAATVSA